MTFTRFFDDPQATQTRDTGGKGANLARLTQRGFPVPFGFVVTAQAYRAFAEPARELLAPLDAIRGGGDRAQLAALAETVQARMAEMPLPPALATELDDALGRLIGRLGPNLRVSVRSSSTLEDLEGSAFAGQHDTFLNVGPAGVADAVRRCYVSLWHHRAVAYRVERGYGALDASMAVVVQQMVQSRASGVAFCINPVSGAVDEISIDANFGLGESVVGGDVSVDHYRLSKAGLTVLERRVGLKEFQVVSDTDGVRHIPTEGEAVEALGPATLAAVGQLALTVEASYGFPQDIEWAVDQDERVHLLQARPVTTFPPHWTRDESAERFPNAMAPLGWEFSDDAFHESLRSSLALMGWPAFHGRWFQMFDNWVYGNQNAVKLLLGSHVLRFRTVDELRALAPTLATRFAYVLELPARWTRDLDRYLLGVGRLLAVDIATLDAAATWARVEAIERLGRSYFAPNIAISMTHGLIHKLLFDLLRLFFEPAAAKGYYDTLTRFCETKTSLINKEVYDLCQLAKATPALEAVLLSENAVELATAGLGTRFPDFAARLGRFLADHGHRETDPDPKEPMWADAPWVVLETVKLLLRREHLEDPFEGEMASKSAQHHAELAVHAALPEDLHFLFAEVVRLARAYSALDDIEHYQTTRLNHLFRGTVLRIGALAVEAGLTADAGDVFFATKAALSAWCTSRTPENATALAARMRTAKADFARHEAEPPVWDRSPTATAPTVIDPSALTGIPGAPGRAEGPVFIVRSVDDFGRFPTGAVLVARTTNPSWTPLFYSACAVITESGGPLSHGAVTAREMGLPAVMAVRGCLARLTHGTRVEVDGDRGTIRIL